MNKLLVVIAFFIAIQFAQAQDYKFGKISKEELLEESNPMDPEANATVLYRYQRIYFEYDEDDGFVQRNAIHERIKIYNKEGFDQATKIVRLYNETSSKSEHLKGLKAVTYNIEDNKIVSTKLKKDGIFEEITNTYWKSKKFTMPNVQEGSVIEYKYEVESPFVGVDDVDFQQTIPIKKLEFKFLSPEYYKYKRHVNPRAAYFPKMIESTKRNKINFTTKTRKYDHRANQTTYGSSSVDYTENIVSVSEVNIPALKDEPMVANLNNYKAKVSFELNYTEFPNVPIESYSTSWEKVSKTIYRYDSFGDQLNKTNYYKEGIDALISGVSNPIEKVALIFNYVKSNVKWNGNPGFTAELGVRKAYKEQAGNVADINLMLVSMLRYAGLNANPVLVSTKDNGIPFFPTRNGFNYVIGIVQLDKGIVLLDATRKFSTGNILPINVLNWKGRLIKKDGTSSWVNLNAAKPSKEIRALGITIHEDFTVSGKIRNQYTDYQALNYRNRYHNLAEEEIVESLLKDKGELEIQNLDIKNLNNLSKPVVQSYEYTHASAIEQIGDKLYFSPMLFLTSEENPFKSDERIYPIDYLYPIADKYMVNIKLPEGYVVDTLPEKAKMQFNGKDAEFSYMTRQNGNTLQLIMTLNINKTLILSSEYPVFKEFYQMMIDKQSEKLVLKKEDKI